MPTTIQNPPPVNPAPDPEEQLAGKQMSFLEHLEELRQRLLRSVVSLAVGFCICFYFAKNFYNVLARPLTNTLQQLGSSEKQLVFTNPVDPFNLYIKLGLLGGVFLASPYILWQLWLFISPGLYRHEKKYVWPFVGLTSSLFLLGGYFAWALAFPAALKFLVAYGNQFTPMVTINEYWDLAMSIIVAVGLVFELPVVLLLLSIFGIVTPRFLWRQMRYAVLITAVVAAAIVPTNDMASIFIVWIPLVGLYVLSIGLSWLVQLKRRKKAEAEAP